MSKNYPTFYQGNKNKNMVKECVRERRKHKKSYDFRNQSIYSKKWEDFPNICQQHNFIREGEILKGCNTKRSVREQIKEGKIRWKM
ncbi:MAG: hypothetical protein DRO88_06355 [Promethearchaeia archaeon]|nr:MAG: hypothetical protein DRO88_06355 [Candidatus Lokiarchaeia archaeon]